jgi:hypothetical protein
MEACLFPHMSRHHSTHKVAVMGMCLFPQANLPCVLLLLLQVWLALEEKGIPYDCVLIELYNKPAWYKELVPTSLVPAVVSMNGGPASGAAALVATIIQQQLQQQQQPSIAAVATSSKHSSSR